MRNLNLFAAVALMCATLMLTNCRGKYSDAVVVMGYVMYSNAGSCSDMWYVLPDGRWVHVEDLAGDKFTSTGSYEVNKDSMTIRLYRYGAETSQAGYLLRVDMEKQIVSSTFIDSNGDVDGEGGIRGVTGPDVKRVDWKGLKALFEKQ
jgi:hypothetical protein